MNGSELLAARARSWGSWLWVLGLALGASVAASQILLGLAAIAALGALFACGPRPRFHPPPGSLPLALYAGWSLISAAASGSPLLSLLHTKELLLLGVPLLGVALLRGGGEVDRAALALLAAGNILAAWGIAQYALGDFNVFERIRGPLSHHLSFAGILLLLFVAAVAWSASCEPRLRRLALLSLAPLALALLLNQSRSAWIGAAAGLLVLCFTPRRRLPVALLVAGTLAVGLHPQFQHKLTSLMNPAADTSLRARAAMLRTGARMVAERPWLGTGPGLIEPAYARLQPADYPLPRVGHLHSTPLQIAAERGVPALAVWGAFWVALLRAVRRPHAGAVGRARAELRSAAAACSAAFLLMGLFEYNFGDAEPSTLMLGLLALPFVPAASRKP
ncbi:MAG: O-antigen ligase family protein [Acidobacteriota bacterium]